MYYTFRGMKNGSLYVFPLNVFVVIILRIKHSVFSFALKEAVRVYKETTYGTYQFI